jgi:hypothetical protein
MWGFEAGVVIIAIVLIIIMAAGSVWCGAGAGSEYSGFVVVIFILLFLVILFGLGCMIWQKGGFSCEESVSCDTRSGNECCDVVEVKCDRRDRCCGDNRFGFIFWIVLIILLFSPACCCRK